jgi:hypothetical protein
MLQVDGAIDELIRDAASIVYFLREQKCFNRLKELPRTARFGSKRRAAQTPATARCAGLIIAAPNDAIVAMKIIPVNEGYQSRLSCRQ